MRGNAIGMVLVLMLPLAAGLQLGSPSAPVGFAPLPADLSDGDLLRLLAAYDGLDVPRLAPLVVPEGVTLPGMVLHLAQRAGGSVEPEDLAPFAQVDPRVAGPLTLALVAVDRAWTMRDAAYAGVADAQLRAALEASRTGQTSDPIPVAQEQVLAAAILLLDTIEGIVIPELQRAFAEGAWPATAIADPVGVLRVGSGGVDVESTNRIFQVDPAGDDWYYNNAGGTRVLADLNPATLDYPISVSLDFAGDDSYKTNETLPAIGGGAAGIGSHIDLAGDDTYEAVRNSNGYGALGGVGLARDMGGGDKRTVGECSMGCAGDGYGVIRDDAGDDSYLAWALSGGASVLVTSRPKIGTGLLWDREGTDSYGIRSTIPDNYGFSAGDGRGWLVDEGALSDRYATSGGLHPFSHGCNDCTWEAGAQIETSQKGGRGNDNRGGLSYLLSRQQGP